MLAVDVGRLRPSMEAGDMEIHVANRGSTPRARRSLTALVLSVAVAVVLAGCGAAGGVREAMGQAMESAGLKQAVPKEHVVPLRLYAADNLNAGSGTRPLALVVRVYQLKGLQRFEQAPFDAFLDEDAERAALGNDLVAANEVLLTPGQRYELQERMAADASHIGIVALFRAPASSRWRFAFDSRKAVAEGITVGLHACALTTTSAALQTQLASEAHALSSVNCAGKRR
ncbi:type VI secretion system-associated lipoprotein [Lysobacter bugurensis]|uniref:Type VI secretion system-associated lipoprotein n=1 Tax=Cognatilysobacter bugurensis TaxID=543356 RepID=A0A918W8W3_9GAMM|nr:type VI secretion system-associated lipoprotein [Lysobacter bugurensis]